MDSELSPPEVPLVGAADAGNGMARGSVPSLPVSAGQFFPENLVLSLKHSARLHGVLLRNVHSSFELGRTRVKKPRGRMQEHPKSHENLNQAVPYNLETTQPTMSDPRNPHCPIPIPPDSRFGREMGRESVSRFSRERESGTGGGGPGPGISWSARPDLT